MSDDKKINRISPMSRSLKYNDDQYYAYFSRLNEVVNNLVQNVNALKGLTRQVTELQERVDKLKNDRGI